MKLSRPEARVFVPGGEDPGAALARTTRLAVGAHADDVEIMAVEGVLACFGQPKEAFSAVVVSDGATGPREGAYRGLSDDEMRQIRRREQERAATVGDYAVQIQLDHSSKALRGRAPEILEDLCAILSEARPSIVYTHNLADAHDTHVAVGLRVLEACRCMPAATRPERVIGCEVWRDLDWLDDARKVRMRVDDREHLQMALLGVFDSQIAGGKRYDRAALGRRRAHATFSEARAADACEGFVFGMDLTPLLAQEPFDPAGYVARAISEFEADACGRIGRLLGK